MHQKKIYAHICVNMRFCVDSGNQPSPLASVESYNHVKRRWEAVVPMPTPRCSCTPLQTTNMLFLIGGVSQGPSNAVEALCLQESVWHTNLFSCTYEGPVLDSAGITDMQMKMQSPAPPESSSHAQLTVQWRQSTGVWTAAWISGWTKVFEV